MNLVRRLIIPFIAIVFFFVPFMTSNGYYVHSVMAKVCIYVILVAGLDLVVGYAGNVSVGHAGLFAAGAYTTAILMWKLEAPFPIAAIAGIIVAAFFGLLLGVPALRLAGPYLAMTTIAFGLIVQTFINESVWLTNGSQGIRSIPALQYGPINFEGNNFYYLVYPLMLLSLLMVHHLVKSYWGRAFEALKESAVAAECSGISRYRYKLAAFVLSAMLAGLAGALFIHIDKYIGPPTFSLQLSILFLIALIFGGTRSILGNVIGTFFVVVLPDVFNNLAEYQLMIFGGVLLFTLYFMPSGVAGLIRNVAAALSRRLSFGVTPSTTPTSKDSLVEGSTESIAAIQREQDAHRFAVVSFNKVQSEGNKVQSEGDSHSEDPLLQTDQLTIAFGGLIAVNKLDFNVRSGHVHALIGPNGSGKSTTVNLLSGVYRPSGGHIQFRGSNIERSPPYAISGKGMARTFQNVALFGDMSVLENVLIGLHHTFHGGLVHVLLGTPRARREEKDARARAQLLLDFVGLGHLATERARNLPYGQQRRLEIARALGQNPALILLDEPAAGLTSGEIALIDELINKLKEFGLGILLIEHHMDLVMAVSDEITVLDFGQKIAEGSPEEIQRNERVISAYLGTTVHGDAGLNQVRAPADA